MIGIVTGLQAEADAFFSKHGQHDADVGFSCRLGDGWAIACAGIGKVHAAMAAQHLVARGCNLLMSLGVAGALDPAIGTGPFWLTHAVQHDYGAARADGFAAFRGGTMPLGIPANIDFAAIDDPGSGLVGARIVTGDSFVENAAAAAALAARHDAQLVDMESAAIAQVAAAHGLPFAGIRSVSDGANEDSADNFQAQLARAAEAAAGAAMAVLPKLQQT